MSYRIAILGSGRGSNAAALLRAEQSGQLGDAEIIGLLSDKKLAGILEHGRSFDKQSLYLPYSKTKEQPYLEQLDAWQPDIIVLAGFMRIIGQGFLSRWEGRIINLHPSLLPAFKGLDAIQQAWDYGVKVTGCTVHWVNAELDGGRIIDQIPVTVDPSDTLESLETKVHAAEHTLLPRVVRQLASAQPV